MHENIVIAAGIGAGAGVILAFLVGRIRGTSIFASPVPMGFVGAAVGAAVGMALLSTGRWPGVEQSRGGRVTEVRDAAALDAIIESARVPVIVFVHSGRDGESRRMRPYLDILAAKRAATARFVAVDTDGNESMALHVGVSSTPTTLIYRRRQEAARAVGFRNEDQLEQLILSSR